MRGMQILNAINSMTLTTYLHEHWPSLIWHGIIFSIRVWKSCKNS